MASDPRSRPPGLWALAGLVGFLALRALLGGGQFVLAPSGDLIGLSPAALADSPFDSFLLPGVVLLALGVASTVVLYGLLRRACRAWYGSIAVAVALAAFVLVEGVVIGFGERLQYLNLAQACVMVVLASLPSVRMRFADE